MSNLRFAFSFVPSNSSFEETKNNFTKKVADRLKELKHIFSFTSFSDTAGFSSHTVNSSSVSPRRKWKGAVKRSMLIPAIIVLAFVLFGGYLIVNSLQNSNNATVSSALSGDDRINIQKAKAAQEMNRSFEFGLKDASGKEVSKIKMIIQNVELRDEIVVKGQRATSIKGRTFLIVNLKITNSFSQPIQINSRDYIRLMVNNSGEMLAPDIHNDPVEIQAISTKYTRVGFPINDSDKDLTLQVGEITGKKETIKLNLK